MISRNRLMLSTAMALVVFVSRVDAHEGPHGGMLFDDADHKFHIELKIDAGKKTATVWVLDDKAKGEVKVKCETIEVHIKGFKDPIKFKAVPPKEGATEFTAFRAENDRFGEKVAHDDVHIMAAVLDGKPAVKFLPED